MKEKNSKKQSNKTSALLIVVMLLGVASFLGTFFFAHEEKQEAQFADGRHVILDTSAVEKDQALAGLSQRVGRVEASEVVDTEEGAVISYQIRFSKEELVADLTEADLKGVEVPFDIGQSVALTADSNTPDAEVGVIDQITLLETDGEIYDYTANFPQKGIVGKLQHDDLVWVHDLELLADGTAAENLQRLRDAFDRGKNYAATRINFPEGEFLIGGPEPHEDYLRLFSNLELIGHHTTLMIDGALVFAGLATGPGAKDGVRHFTMQGLNFQATDLETGNFVAVVANHGSDWKILNNRFGLVHAMSTHVFDLGGLQDSLFEHNTFEGYAPNLTKERKLGDWTLHNIYSEAIQLDASTKDSPWDGGFLASIDPNYEKNNPERQISQNITIRHNHFLPYYKEDGQVVAYGATIGQHSSEVGPVTIQNNVFKETLASRFRDQVPEADRWLLEPIHLYPKEKMTIEGNQID